MKEYPCPYSKPMILAKLIGIKSQTRRIMKPQPSPLAMHMHCDLNNVWRCGRNQQEWAEWGTWKSPRGTIGDRQYWQEAFDFGGMPMGSSVKFCRIKYKADPISSISRLVALTDREHSLVSKWKQPDTGKWRGMPAMYMLRSMSRGLDEIVDVRVERLQDITEEDAMHEGCERPVLSEGLSWEHPGLCKMATHPMTGMYRDAYKTLWDSINAKRPGCAWKDNPFVWIYETRRVHAS